MSLRHARAHHVAATNGYDTDVGLGVELGAAVPERVEPVNHVVLAVHGVTAALLVALEIVPAPPLQGRAGRAMGWRQAMFGQDAAQHFTVRRPEAQAIASAYDRIHQKESLK